MTVVCVLAHWRPILGSFQCHGAMEPLVSVPWRKSPPLIAMDQNSGSLHTKLLLGFMDVHPYQVLIHLHIPGLVNIQKTIENFHL